MKKLVFLTISLMIVFLSLTGCSSEKKEVYNAEQIVQKLKDANLPISNIIVYTEDTDPNSKLGRPNEYISKVNFADTTVDQSADLESPTGGSIETFSNSMDLQTRKTYLEKVFDSFPMYKQYLYVNGNYLLRIDYAVSPTNAAKYESALKEIK